VEAPRPVAPGDALPAAQTVTFETTDGVTISAVLRQGATTDAPAVILVHKLSSSHVEWDVLLARLTRAPALTTLAIDMRGHGASTHGSNGRTIDWNGMSDDDWRATALDVRAAVDWLATRAPVHPSRIAAVGASIGSSAVIAAAAEDPRVVAVVALSPGRAYHGFDAVTPATRLGDRPLFALAARDETDSVDMAQALDHIVPRGASLIVDGDAHGVDMFTTAPASADRVDDFLRTALGTRPPPPPG
jgi:pimeloyl-ACP methyl ester carboxylesterase